MSLPESIRITGFTIHGEAQDPQVYTAGTLNVGGGPHAVRVDHVNFVQPGSGCLIINGDNQAEIGRAHV